MLRTTLASAALIALAHAAGDAIVVNKCNYDVYMENTPASGGGYSTIPKTLTSGETYTQPWTQLSNGNGWSIKLSKTPNAFLTNILQYEYTFHDDGTIWYDLSEVDGNPWDKNWEILATDGCTPRQAAYRYSTDDAYGMQSCGDEATITVIVCSGDDAGSSEPSATDSWGSDTTTAPATYPTEAATSKTKTKNGGHHTWGGAAKKVVAPAGDAIIDNVAAPEPIPEEAEAYDGAAVTVTNVKVATLTKYVTATAAPAKRHEHHARHPHHRR